MKEELTEIPIESIRAGSAQPRKEFNEEELNALKNSIAEIGLIHPPVVRRENDGTYSLISGERRFRACQLLQKKQIPVIIRDYDDKAAAIGSLVENIQRVDLNPMEVAFGIKNLIDEFNFSQQDVALKIGKERSSVSNFLRLIQLPKSIQKSLRINEITMGHAKAILALEDDYHQELLHEMIIREGLSVREAETKARALTEKSETNRTPPMRQRDFHLEDLERKIQESVGVRVSIEGNAKKGRISLIYSSLDDIDRILKALKIDCDL